MCKELLEFIDNSPTPFHAVKNICDSLESFGFTKLCEGNKWNISKGGKYYVTRNMSSIIAFEIPEDNFNSFMITASHCDSPSYKIKENSELVDNNYVRLSTEGYGGMICSTWLDRPLSIAGRVTVKSSNGIDTVLCNLKDMSVIIPNLAIHFNRDVNRGVELNQAVDMVPLFGMKEQKGSFKKAIADNIGISCEDIISYDLFLYNCEKGKKWGSFISAPRLDDLECAYTCLKAFENAKNEKSAPIYCCFDNEEVGSQTKQGANSTFLSDVIGRICEILNMSIEEKNIKLSNSLMLSCDNAHALHPNHPEKHDRNHISFMNKGIVIKYNANQKYTSDAISCGLFKLICERAGVPYQSYANRADLAGGSTLGNISNTHVSLNTIDIGLPQLAMHSAYETAGAEDPEYMIKAVTEFYSSSVKMDSDGNYKI